MCILRESHTHQKSHHLQMMLYNEMETQEWYSSSKGLPYVRSQWAIAEKERMFFLSEKGVELNVIFHAKEVSQSSSLKEWKPLKTLWRSMHQ